LLDFNGGGNTGEEHNHNRVCAVSARKGIMLPRLRAFFFFCYCVHVAHKDDIEQAKAASQGVQYVRAKDMWKLFILFHKNVQENLVPEVRRDLTFLTMGASVLMKDS
jgi:hypothetical protein